jgi:F-type H+-transporting ATPase subunit b
VIDSLALLLAEPPEGAHEAHEAAHAFLGVPFWIWQTVNLALFLALLVYFLRKPAAKFFAERSEGVAASLARATEQRARAEQLVREAEGRLGRIEGEIAELKKTAQTHADAEQAAMTAQTEADAARIVARATTEMDSRVRSARVELTGYAGDLAVEIAEELLEKNVTPEDHARLLHEGVAALGAAQTRVRKS